MELLQQITDGVIAGKAKIVKELMAQGLEQGIGASDLLDALIKGMSFIGEKFKNNEVYVPEVLITARAMNQGMELLKPELARQGVKAAGTVVIGTVKGDLHDIGKNLVRMMLEGRGLTVIDLGVDVSADTFVEEAINNNADIICCSALLTTTMDEMRSVVEAATAKGIRDKVKIMIGGAPITQNFCDSIGADAYTSDAASAADAAFAFVG